MNHSSPSPKKNLNNRFPYLIGLKAQEKEQKRTLPSPEFNFNLCTENPCKNQLSQLQLVNNDFTQQQIKKRKPPKIQLQSVNFQSFKKKVQQNSFPNSFLAYTPSKDSQNQHFTIDNQISTIECPKTKLIQTQRYEIPYESGSELYYSGTRMSKQRQLSNWKQNSQDDKSFNSNFNEFIRLQLSDTDKSSFQSPRQLQDKANQAINEQFLKCAKIDISLSTGKKSARLSDLEPSKISMQNSLDFSVSPSVLQTMSPKQVTKKKSQQTIATVKTKQMSSRLSQNNQFQYEHSISWTPTNSQKLQKSEEVLSTRSAIKLKGKVMKKS